MTTPAPVTCGEDWKVIAVATTDPLQGGIQLSDLGYIHVGESAPVGLSGIGLAPMVLQSIRIEVGETLYARAYIGTITAQLG